MNYVLFKNGKIKRLKKCKKYKKSKVNMILFEVKSNLFGTAYEAISPTTYKRMKSIDKISLSYKFLDGYLYDIDDEDKDELLVKNKYTYNNAIDLLKKFDEIYMTENILNDLFWVYDSFLGYAFTDFKIKIFDKKGKHKFHYDAGVCDYLKINNDMKEPINNSIIEFNKNSYKLYDKPNKYFKKNINMKSKYLISLYNGLFIQINPKFFKDVKSLHILSKLYDVSYESKELYNEYDVVYNKKRNRISWLVENYFSNKVVKKLEEDNEIVSYSFKSKIIELNGKKEKTSYKKFFNKYFKLHGGIENED